MIDIEKNFSRLEEINESIRDPKRPLSEVTALFEEGISLSNQIEKALNDVEHKVEILTNPPADRGEASDFQLFSEDDNQ